jgi:siroheme synthase
VTLATLATIAEAAERDGLEAPIVTVIGEVARMGVEGVVPIAMPGREVVAAEA